MKFYTPGKLSENIRETPEGYLLCLGVQIARTGWQEYGAGDCPLEPGPDGIVRVYRDPKEVFKPTHIASYQGKSITIRHPQEFVSPKNWKELTYGSGQNVRRSPEKDEDGEESLLADLLITDDMAIGLVKNGLREVSCGYDAEYVQTGVGEGRQENMIGNHIALVEEGRAGPSYAINDHKGKGTMEPKTLIEKLKKILGAKVVDDAMAEAEKPAAQVVVKTGDEAGVSVQNVSYDEFKKSMDAFGAKLDSFMKGGDGTSHATQGDPAVTVAADEPKSIEERMSALETAIAKLLETKAGDESEEEEETGDEEESEEEEVGDEEEEESSLTGDMKSRIEIVAPGLKIAKGEKNPKGVALKAAYATADGKALINTLTGGKEPPYDQPAAINAIFAATSELLKKERVGEFSKTKTRDSNSGEIEADTSTAMTAEKMNEMNAKHYAQKRA